MWLLQLSIIILACHTCGWIAEHLGQCRVVGEIIAGILLGPSVFGALTPSFYGAMFAPIASPSMSQLGEVGLVLLMFEIGLHSYRRAPGSISSLYLPGIVASLGFVAPFVGGVVVALSSKDMLAPGVPALPYTLFCGTALSVSAVPVMARMVVDLDLGRYPAASAALSAAIITDVAGWLLLALVASLSTAEASVANSVRSVFELTAYLACCIVATRYVISPIILQEIRRNSLRAVMTIVVCFVFASAWVTSNLGFHSAFGALLPGMLLREIQKLRELWDQWFGGFIRIVLMPVFFSYTGLHTSISAIDGYSSWFWLSMFLCVGFIGKFSGSYFGARLARQSANDAAIIGSLMNARGLMELIVLSVGLQLNILPLRVYSMLVIFALITTAMAAPLVRFYTRRKSMACQASNLIPP
ncbi:Kef-type K+ transport system, membrane component [Thiomonas sp. X19]|uniref:cation:proton antiporter n=1 Tax=Thiomonas sp. X19 TaxID=1050370 RepID=UPI000B69498B|nr:cation:proton antiporter [Thiomonas sp. X19]SCC93147.1 Kef-type K+ transport system, membrane component [Thiomonas sp. X19]SCC93894.1 Kef-type K+ transport system, membrane component [Thiomonas sp. X19]